MRGKLLHAVGGFLNTLGEIYLRRVYKTELSWKLEFQLGSVAIVRFIWNLFAVSYLLSEPTQLGKWFEVSLLCLRHRTNFSILKMFFRLSELDRRLTESFPILHSLSVCGTLVNIKVFLRRCIPSWDLAIPILVLQPMLQRVKLHFI